MVDGEAVEASILNVPSFLYKEELKVESSKWGMITNKNACDKVRICSAPVPDL